MSVVGLRADAGEQPAVLVDRARQDTQVDDDASLLLHKVDHLKP